MEGMEVAQTDVGTGCTPPSALSDHEEFKVKNDTKGWFDRDLMGAPEEQPPLSMKPMNSGDINNSFRSSQPPSSMGSDSPLSGPRPSPLPHGGHPFSQSPDPRSQMPPQMNQQFIQQFPPHPGLREMSPGFQNHPRGLLQHSHAIVNSQDHLQQLHHHYGQPQHQMNLTGNHLQQLSSPYNQGMLRPGMGNAGNPRGHELREGDPYSFVDEYTGPPPRPVEEVLGNNQPKRRGRKPKHIKLLENGGDPLAIAAAQAAHEAKKRKWKQMGPDGKPICFPQVKPPRKRLDGFDLMSMPDEDLSLKILPDHLAPNLDIVIIGINPGVLATYKGHHYAGPGNHFWKCLYLSGLIPEPFTSDDDRQLMDYGIGFTNIVSRSARGPSELTRKEIKEGGQLLLAKMQRFQPRIAVFNGKGIYEVFAGKKDFTFGRQPERIEGTRTHVWVMPSSSARCAQLPRALDKVPFYTALRKFRDFLKGTIPELTEEEVNLATSKNCVKNLLKDCDKLGELHLDDDPTDLYMEDTESLRFEGEMDSEEISRCISQSLYNLRGMSMEQLEALECPTIPVRKKRGRPKKSQEDPNGPVRPKPPSAFGTEYLMCNEEEPPRKKRGRPKKVLEDGTIAPPKRAGRKPKALKEVLANQTGAMGPHMHHSQHSQMGHLNGMMSPSGYNGGSGIPPFSPQFGGHHVHHMNGPHSQGDMMHSHIGLGNANPHRPGMNNFPGSHNSMHSNHGGLLPVNTMHQHGCPTPTSTPQGYSHSPVYSPGPLANQIHRMGPGYPHRPDKNDLMEEDRALGLSPLPGSPIVTQSDFETPGSLPESESLLSESRSSVLPNQDDSTLPSIQSQYSDSSTAPEDSTSFSSFPNYPPATSTTTSTFVSSASPSYPPSVSCSPSYTPLLNTQSPYPTNSVQSPSYHQNMTQSPSCQSKSAQSPSYPAGVTNSPTFSSVTQPSSFPGSNTQSPSYSTLNNSPSYTATVSQSPSYRPSTSQSPSFQSPGSNQSPFATTINNSPHSKTEQTLSKNDVSSKSLSGLESLVDQIPSINDAESGLTNGPCSNPTTPATPSSDPFSPGQSHKSATGPYPNFNGGGSGQPYGAHYDSPQGPNFSPQSGQVPSNYPSATLSSNPAVPAPLPFEGGEGSPHSINSNNNVNVPRSSASAPSLTRGTPTPTNSLYANSFSPTPTGPSPHSYDMMNSSGLPPTPPMGPNFMGSVMSGHMGSPMSMNSQIPPYSYNQYSESPPNCYTGSGHPPFPYPSSPGFPVSSQRYGYPTPYTNGPYAQGYPQNTVLDRIKQTGMGMGFGGY